MVRLSYPGRTTPSIMLTKQPPPSSDPKVNTLLATIQSERRNLEGAKAVVRAVEASSRNEAVIQQARNEVRSAQEAIKFLEDELAKLQMGGSGAGSPMRPSGSGQQNAGGYGDGRGGPPGAGAGAPGHGGPGGQGMGGYGGPMTPSKSHASLNSGNGMMSPSPSKRPGDERPLPPPPPGEAPQQGMEAAKPGQKNYTQLGESRGRHMLVRS